MDQNLYGTKQTNPITPQMREFIDRANASGVTVEWTDKRLDRIVRLRLLSDPGYPHWDVSYCVGELKDGTPVRVQLPFSQLPRRGSWKAIVDYAIKDKVHAKRLKVFDAISLLV